MEKGHQIKEPRGVPVEKGHEIKEPGEVPVDKGTREKSLKLCKY